jgi:16S rRNA (uracil1498-N3)-methyltransferase
MIFFYHQNSGEEFLKVEDELYRHIFKSRRASKEKTLNFRNLTDDILYTYEILEIGKKSASLKLLSSALKPNKPKQKTTSCTVHN